MAKPILYGPGYSTYTRAARLAMEEKGVDYELVEVDFISGGFSDEYLERQPFAKVPAFEHDGLELYETPAILRYIDEAFDRNEYVHFELTKVQRLKMGKEEMESGKRER